MAFVGDKLSSKVVGAVCHGQRHNSYSLATITPLSRINTKAPHLPEHTNRRHRPWRWIIPIVAVLAALTTGLLIYVYPPQSVPKPADAVFVIGPPDQWRIEWAQQMIAHGDAHALMISVPNAASIDQCSQHFDYPVYCKRPDPFTTQGESRWLQQEMRAQGWKRVIVITTTPHVVRARLYMYRCNPHGVQVVGRATGLDFQRWISQIVYQTGAFVKAFTNTRGC